MFRSNMRDPIYTSVNMNNFFASYYAYYALFSKSGIHLTLFVLHICITNFHTSVTPLGVL